MRHSDARGSFIGLLATCGYVVVLLVEALVLTGAFYFMAFWWSGFVYGIALAMGTMQLIFVLWGNTPCLRGVRFSRKLEYPPEFVAEGAQR